MLGVKWRLHLHDRAQRQIWKLMTRMTCLCSFNIFSLVPWFDMPKKKWLGTWTRLHESQPGSRRIKSNCCSRVVFSLLNHINTLRPTRFIRFNKRFAWLVIYQIWVISQIRPKSQPSHIHTHTHTHTHTHRHTRHHHLPLGPVWPWCPLLFVPHPRSVCWHKCC